MRLPPLALLLALLATPAGAQCRAPTGKTRWFAADKAGHALASYGLTDLTRRTVIALGVEPRAARYLAAGTTLAVGTWKECVHDTRNPNNFSEPWDMAWNVVGVSLAFRLGRDEGREAPALPAPSPLRRPVPATPPPTPGPEDEATREGNPPAA